VLKRWAAWPRTVRWLAGGIAAVVLAMAVAWVLFVPAADWLAHHDVGSAKGPLLQTARDSARGRLLTLGAGLFAAGALIFTALNFNLLRRNSERTDQWQRRTYELTEQGQVTDRYSKAIEQLGSSTIDVTIGGIYALERIARESPRDHPTVMEVLAACIREHSRERWPKPEPDGEIPERSTRPDIQAALTVIGRRDTKQDVRPIDLSGADLTRAKLSGAVLSGAFLIHANLVAADFTGANLRAADFTRANVSGTVLSGAILDDAMWPRDAPVPEGWKRDTPLRRLKRAGTDSGPAEAN
jgi:Pentapeptide repeats (8 copies)